MVLWSAAGVALLVALASWLRARALARKLEALNQSYWELRYDFSRLRSQVARLDPGDPEQQESASPAPSPGQLAFVPLSSIKKKSG